MAKEISTIYIEERAYTYETTKRVLSKLPNARVIPIKHYKDIFNRRNQDFLMQKANPALILAVNDGERIYKGSRFCQDFDNEHFYYTSQIKNCLYDCEYCFLQGMYPSGNIVVFVNIEAYFSDIDKILKEHPVYISISYDTDLLALNGLTGLLDAWCEYANAREDILIEIRTKCASSTIVELLKNKAHAVLAYTISPTNVASKYEHGAGSYEARRTALYKAIDANIPTRLCLDPCLPVTDYEKVYGDMIDDIFSYEAMKNIKDVSIGSFRISKEYLKAMRAVRHSPLTTYPYTNNDGMATFDSDLEDNLLRFITKKLLEYIPEEKIFRWN